MQKRINERYWAFPSQEVFRRVIHHQFSSPSKVHVDRVAALEIENESLRQILTHSRDAFNLVSRAHEYCLAQTQSSRWSTDQIERLREIAALMRQALNVRNSGSRFTENDATMDTNAEIASLKQQLAREYSARRAAERKLSQYIKDWNKAKRSSPKVGDEIQVKDMN